MDVYGICQWNKMIKDPCFGIDYILARGYRQSTITILNDKCDGKKKASSRIKRNTEVEGQMAIFKGRSGFYSLRKHLSQNEGHG